MSTRRKPTPAPVPLGAALNTDDAALDLAALITPEDIEAAQVDAARAMSKRGAAMLEAARVETAEEKPQ